MCGSGLVSNEGVETSVNLRSLSDRPLVIENSFISTRLVVCMGG